MSAVTSSTSFSVRFPCTASLLSIADPLSDRTVPIIKKIAIGIFAAIAIPLGILFTLAADGVFYLFPNLRTAKTATPNKQVQPPKTTDPAAKPARPSASMAAPETARKIQVVGSGPNSRYLSAHWKPGDSRRSYSEHSYLGGPPQPPGSNLARFHRPMVAPYNNMPPQAPYSPTHPNISVTPPSQPFLPSVSSPHGPPPSVMFNPPAPGFPPQPMPFFNSAPPMLPPQQQQFPMQPPSSSMKAMSPNREFHTFPALPLTSSMSNPLPPPMNGAPPPPPPMPLVLRLSEEDKQQLIQEYTNLHQEIGRAIEDQKNLEALNTDSLKRLQSIQANIRLYEEKIETEKNAIGQVQQKIVEYEKLKKEIEQGRRKGPIEVIQQTKKGEWKVTINREERIPRLNLWIEKCREFIKEHTEKMEENANNLKVSTLELDESKKKPANIPEETGFTGKTIGEIEVFLNQNKSITIPNLQKRKEELKRKAGRAKLTLPSFDDKPAATNIPATPKSKSDQSQKGQQDVAQEFFRKLVRESYPPEESCVQLGTSPANSPYHSPCREKKTDSNTRKRLNFDTSKLPEKQIENYHT